MKVDAKSLPRLLDRLEAQAGPPPRRPPRTALEWVLWENAGYLVDDEKRAKAYRALAKRTGPSAAGILALPREELLAIAKLGGMHPERRVEKLVAIAVTVRDAFGGDLEAELSGTLPRARRALKRFPGIGAPGADAILLFTGRHALAALESNGLRVLVRLGLAHEDPSYAKSYRSAVEALAPHLGRGCAWLERAHGLLRRHGQTLCRRTAPACDECPLADGCPSSG